MLNRIRSAQAVGKTDIVLPSSGIKNEIAEILLKENFISEVKKIAKGKKKFLKIGLNYKNGEPAIEGLSRISKSGQRIYARWNEIKKTRGGYGFSIISTSKGLMTGKEAKKAKMGGEILLEVW